jgi:RNA polymerase sigma-70 factor, ECF subfamily
MAFSRMTHDSVSSDSDLRTNLQKRAAKNLKDHFVPLDRSSESTISSSAIERARQGDHHAFQRLSNVYSGLVYHWCRTAGLSPEDSEDVGQQVFLSVSRGLVHFRREKPGDSFRGWLRVVTRSRIVDHFRKNAKHERGTESIQDFLDEASIRSLSQEESLVDRHHDTMILYERAIQLLKGAFAEQDCTAFQMVVVDGIAPKEVAAQLGVSVNSVYIAKSRILKRLRDEFEDLFTDDLA